MNRFANTISFMHGWLLDLLLTWEQIGRMRLCVENLWLDAGHAIGIVALLRIFSGGFRAV